MECRPCSALPSEASAPTPCASRRSAPPLPSLATPSVSTSATRIATRQRSLSLSLPLPLSLMFHIRGARDRCTQPGWTIGRRERSSGAPRIPSESSGLAEAAPASFIFAGQAATAGSPSRPRSSTSRGTLARPSPSPTRLPYPTACGTDSTCATATPPLPFTPPPETRSASEVAGTRTITAKGAIPRTR